MQRWNGIFLAGGFKKERLGMGTLIVIWTVFDIYYTVNKNASYNSFYNAILKYPRFYKFDKKYSSRYDFAI